MTYIKFVQINCDFEGCNNNISYSMGDTATKTRKMAKKEGWKSNKGNDYCHLHSKALGNKME